MSQTSPDHSHESESNFDLRLAVEIDAPPERVFELWTTRLSDWWGPHGMTTRVVAMDLRAGGAFQTVMRTPDGTEIPTRGVFLEVVANRRIVFTDAYEPSWKPAPGHFMTAVIDFVPVPGGRTLLAACARHKSAEDRATHEQMGFHEGWGESFAKLAALARGTRTPPGI